ncbi:MAG: hypothetical protein K5770_03415 [Lachnospiraceae bacterium]|nr:hypothetical protein [Lachnospiraceae bacterium]
MKNMMKEYLGNDYSNNHLRNFCLYWIKAFECRDRYSSYDEWRKENDLDCQYLAGDLRADTLMSAWTPIKWVADNLNRDIGVAFYKTSRISSDPLHDLRLLAEDGDSYLPYRNELVKLLYRFLELAELRCNFILLPSREMNPARYQCFTGGEKVWLFDEVPATLSHIFDRNSLGRFFTGSDHAIRWVRREHLEMGFEDEKIDLYHVRPLINGLDPCNPKWLTNENEIREALKYMIGFLEARMKVFTDIEENGLDIDGYGDYGETCNDSPAADPGSICFEASMSGYNKVACSIGKVFEKIKDDGLIRNADRIDFHIKGDVSDEEAGQIDDCIRRLLGWYDEDREIQYMYEYKIDETMSRTCETCAYVHLRKQGRLIVPEKKAEEKGEFVRPEAMHSDVLWDIYRLFNNMYRPYLWVDTGSRHGKYSLYLIKDTAFGHGGTDYGVGNMGIELPWSRKEWIDLKLIKAYGNGRTESTCRICTDAMRDCNDTIEKVLHDNHMRLQEGFY